MKINNLKKFILAIVLCGYYHVSGQEDGYGFEREILNVHNEWHSIHIPDDMFKHVSTPFHDIRIFNTEGQEIPYIYQEQRGNSNKEFVSFAIINASTRNGSSFFSLENKDSSNERPISKINLTFSKTDFDRRIKLKGSNDNTTWYSILDNYRIASIKSNQQIFNFTTLEVPQSNYTYYRLEVKNTSNATLLRASSRERTEYKEYLKPLAVDYFNYVVTDNKETIVDYYLRETTPIDQIEIPVDFDGDYFRRFKVENIREIETENGIKEVVDGTAYGILSSEGTNSISCDFNRSNRLKITIYDEDNQPLKLKEIIPSRRIRKLLVKFGKAGEYTISYGNPNAKKPRYDIVNFTDRIPENLTTVDLSDEITLAPTIVQDNDSQYTSKWWLWILMFLIIAVIGYASINMLKANPKNEEE